MTDSDYLVALHQVPHLGTKRLKGLKAHFGSYQQAWESRSKQWLQDPHILDPPEFQNYLTKQGIMYITEEDAQYSEALKHIDDPPLILYYKGHLELLNQPAVAVVGTRKATKYGQLLTEQFTAQLVQWGLVIVSGLAQGIDTIAHKTTLSSKGLTIAVLGHGLNHLFPADNFHLSQQIIAQGGILISEYSPHTPAKPGHFPARNRIIAGLSQLVIVPEATIDSGSLITARLAAEQGKEVLVVPGPITSPTSKGCHYLLKNGAVLLENSEDIARLLGITSMSQISTTSLSQMEQELIRLLEQTTTATSDYLAEQLQISFSELSLMLTQLEMKQLVIKTNDGSYLPYKI